MALHQLSQSLFEARGINRSRKLQSYLAGIARKTAPAQIVIEPEHEIIAAVEWRIIGH